MNRLAGWLATAFAAIALAVACTGDQRTAGIDRGGVRVPVAASGPITGFGSIYVSGTRFDIGQARIDINGAAGTEADLAIGQIVAVTGEIDEDDNLNGSAARVVFESNVTGDVEAVDGAAGTLVVLGQTVVADAAVLDVGNRRPVVGSFFVGDRVEVSGHVAADGSIIATRVALTGPGEMRVRGTVGTVNLAATRLTINALTVDYSAAGLIEGFASGQPAVGDVVVAVGNRTAGSGPLIATRLRRIDDFDAASGQRAEVEDLITRFVSAADFSVGSVAVRADAGTVYEGGSAADLAQNVKVQVEGRVASDGVLEATKIEVKDGGRVY